MRMRNGELVNRTADNHLLGGADPTLSRSGVAFEMYFKLENSSMVRLRGSKEDEHLQQLNFVWS